jgi:DNA repair protein RadA/Sms
VGLGGELRAVNRIDSRIAEAEKLGFDTIYISKYNKNLDSQKTTIKVKAFGLLPDVFGDLFG